MAQMQYWSGFCMDCECRWEGMQDQNCCPNCDSKNCDLETADGPGDEIVQQGAGGYEPSEFCGQCW